MFWLVGAPAGERSQVKVLTWEPPNVHRKLILMSYPC
jgi:hypothetical protein